MQSTIFPIVGEGLIAGIDDCPIELHPLVDVIHDVISPLADLEIHVTRPIGQFEIRSERIRLSNPAGTSKNLTGRQERQKRRQYFWSELRFPVHQIIFVAAECRTGVVIDVVLEKGDLIFDAHFCERPIEEKVAGNIE